MDILKPYRAKIDAIDDQIVDLLAARVGIIREVAALKKQNGIPAILPDRVNEVINRCVARGEGKGIDPALARDLYTRIVGHACTLEEELMRTS